MGAGFTRRYNFVPGSSVIALIEGIIILDLPPPGNITGVATGVACLVAEFVDQTYGAAVDVNGVVTQSPNPVQIFSGQDLLNKVGGFDPTIGDFGGSMGNGFVELRNKAFSQLIVLPVSLASTRGIRAWRKLPFNTSPTVPTPNVPMQPAQVVAGTQLVAGSSLVNSAAPIQFSGNLPYVAGTDGNVAPSVGATEAFTSPSGNFINAGVAVGDVIVLGAPLQTATVISPTGAAFVGATDAFLYAAPGVTTYPSAGLLQLDAELVTYSGVTSSATAAAFTGLTRGVNGTVGATHAAGIVAVGMNNVDTYRINAIPGATALTLERQEATGFNASTSFGASAVPWRIHHAADAESAAGIRAAAGTYAVFARPLSAAIPAATLLAPSVPSPGVAYNSWSPLSGFAAQTDPTVGLTFVAAVQGINPGPSPTLDALYANAIAALLSQNEPEASINLVWASRKSANIRAAIRTSVDQESAIGLGRMAVIAPDLSVATTSAAVATGDPGVGAIRDERVAYTWPPVQSFVPEAVNVNVKGADGKLYQNGIIDMPADGWLIAVLSNLNPELNPGQAAEPVPTILSPVAGGLARNITAALGINDYTTMRQYGICGIRIDRAVGPVFQSGVTTSLTPGQTTIQRRRMADFCEDSIADALAPLAKLPATALWVDNVTTEIDQFLDGLQSPDNPQLSRITAYLIDDVSGNTSDLNNQGIYVWIVKVKTTPTADFIVLQFNVGNNVVVAQQLGT